MFKEKFMLRLIKSFILIIACCSIFYMQAGTVFADTLGITVGTGFTIDNGGSSIRHFPLLEVDGSNVYTSFSQHIDDHIDHPTDGLRISRDSGSTWQTYMQNQDFYLTSITKLSNGNLFGMSYMQYVDSHTDKFDNDTVGQVPVGYTQVGASGLVSNTYAYSGSNSLRIYDNSSSVCTNIVKVTSASASKTFEFLYYPVAFSANAGNMISINSGGNTDSNSVFHLKIDSNGKIYWYNIMPPVVKTIFLNL